MNHGIKNNRRGYVRVSGSPSVVLDPGLNRVTDEQLKAIQHKAAYLFKERADGNSPTLELVDAPKGTKPARVEGPKDEAKTDEKPLQGNQPQGQKR